METQSSRFEESVKSAFVDIVKDTVSEVFQEYRAENPCTPSQDSPYEFTGLDDGLLSFGNGPDSYEWQHVDVKLDYEPWSFPYTFTGDLEAFSEV